MNTPHHIAKESERMHRNRELVEEICSDCCRPGHYCTLKEITVRSPRDARTMLMIKCIEKLKYERSQQAGHDIGWNEAFMAWIQESFINRFHALYHPGVRLATIYREVMEGQPTTAKNAQDTSLEKNP